MRISRTDFLLSLALGGSVPALSQGNPQRHSPAANRSFGPLTLTQGSLFVNGRELQGRFSAQVSEFRFLYFAVPSNGLFVFSASEFSDATQAGSFDGAELKADVGGTSVVLRSRTPILQGEQIPAWVHFDSEFKTDLDGVMFGYGDSEGIPYGWPSRSTSNK